MNIPVSFPAEQSEALRGEGNPGVNTCSISTTWIPFPRIAAFAPMLAGDDSWDERT